MDETICVIGTGYIGLPLCVSLAEAGYTVIGLDKNQAKVDGLAKLIPDIHEPGLKEALEKTKDKLTFTTDSNKALSSSDIILITVGTPFRDKYSPNYAVLEAAITEVGQNLKKGQLIVLKSTVIVGSTEEFVLPRLEKISGLKAGVDFHLAFSPERTVAGKAIEEFHSLPKIVAGINEASRDRAVKVLEKLGGKIIPVSNLKVAELCKIIDNYYRAANITLANEIGFLCEKAGVSATEVVAAVNNSYDRTRLFQPALGADGPCLTKDTKMFWHTCLKYGLTSSIAGSVIEVSEFSDHRIVSIASRFIYKNNIQKPKIAILGLAFKGKPETDDIRDAPAVKIFKAVQERFANEKFSFYDPVVTTFLGNACEKTDDAALQDANVVLILTNHPKLETLTAEKLLKHVKKPCLIIDAWNNIKNAQKIHEAEGVDLFQVGEPKSM